MTRAEHNAHYGVNRQASEQVSCHTLGYGEFSQYDSDCSGCWFGHQHTWERHDAALARIPKRIAAHCDEHTDVLRRDDGSCGVCESEQLATQPQDRCSIVTRAGHRCEGLADYNCIRCNADICEFDAWATPEGHFCAKCYESEPSKPEDVTLNPVSTMDVYAATEANVAIENAKHREANPQCPQCNNHPALYQGEGKPSLCYYCAISDHVLIDTLDRCNSDPTRNRAALMAELDRRTAPQMRECSGCGRRVLLPFKQNANHYCPDCQRKLDERIKRIADSPRALAPIAGGSGEEPGCPWCGGTVTGHDTTGRCVQDFPIVSDERGGCEMFRHAQGQPSGRVVCSAPAAYRATIRGCRAIGEGNTCLICAACVDRAKRHGFHSFEPLAPAPHAQTPTR